jgi:hypothetical protein
MMRHKVVDIRADRRAPQRCHSSPWTAAGCALAVATVVAGGAWADDGQGTISYAAKSGAITVTVKNAYLVKGPDMAAGKTIRRLIFSASDLGPKIKGCQAMACSENDLREGLALDLDAGSPLKYWFTANGQKVQYSGTVVATALKLTADTPQRLAGKLTLDDSSAGGPKAEIDFDVPMTKEFTRWR